MESINDYQDAEKAFQDAKAKALAAIDTLHAQIEVQKFTPEFPWGTVGRMTEASRRVELAISTMNGGA